MTTTIETNHHADPVPAHPPVRSTGHEFTSTPELNESGKGIDNRLHTSHRVSCSCGAAWTFKTDEIAARVTAVHLRRVTR